MATRRSLRNDQSALATLVRLFQLGDELPSDTVEAVLPLPDALPLLEKSGSRLRAAYDVSPYADESHDWFVVSDLTGPASRPLRRDHVLGVGGASGTLAQLAVRRPVARALDVGIGCGVQSLHLATHAEQVTGVDAVPRALQLAATTAALNGLAWELVAGDLTAPVAEREFDQVVCNPPFVVGPAARYDYRDGVDAAVGDDMSRRAVRSCAAVLADGGVAQLLVNWLHVHGEDWRDRVAGWVSDLGVDGWLIQREVSEPVDYVRTWLDDAGERGDSDLATAWLDWFDTNRISGVGMGWVVLRRGAGPHRVAVEAVTHPVEQPLGTTISGWLDRTEWLRGRDDGALLRQAFRAAPGVRLDTASYPSAEGWSATASQLALDEGFRWQLPTDEATAAIVAGCDGTTPLSQLVAVLAQALREPADAVASAASQAVRALVDRGILLP